MGGIAPQKPVDFKPVVIPMRLLVGKIRQRTMRFERLAPGFANPSLKSQHAAGEQLNRLIKLQGGLAGREKIIDIRDLIIYNLSVN
ncbi:MAG: hypothetical protein ACRD2G_15195 [Terriglobia bacterium]